MVNQASVENRIGQFTTVKRIFKICDNLIIIRIVSVIFDKCGISDYNF